MRSLPLRAQVYLLVCFLGGLLALGRFLSRPLTPISFDDWLLTVSLGFLASACQVLVVARRGTAGQRSDHLTLAPLFAAVLLLPPQPLALVIIWTFIPEWYFRDRSWFGQVFNISVYLIAATLVRLALITLTDHPRLTTIADLLTLEPLPLVLLIIIFELTQSMMLALVLWLARGQSLRQSGLFAPESLQLELSLLATGLGFALAWLVAPFYGLLSAIPLLLIFQALHVPNLKEQAATDPKTGLLNMRHFNEMAEREFTQARRHNSHLSILMCDLDYLRNINNTYGHQAGDIVLIGIADIIRNTVRTSDLTARFGGEEFVILLPDANIENALQIAERVRTTLEWTRFDVGAPAGPIGATISIGVAAFPQHGQNLEEIMREADLAVYQAKRRGRNRVIVAGYESRTLAGEWEREHLAHPPPAPRPLTEEHKRPFQESIERLTGASYNQTEPPLQQHHRPKEPVAPPVPPPAAPPPVTARPPIFALILVIVAAGFLALLPGLTIGNIPWLPLLLYAGLTLLAEQFAIENTGQGKVSVSIVPILAAAYLYHEVAILVTALAAVTSLALRVRRFSHRMYFNFGTILLAAQGTHLIFHRFAGTTLDPTAISRLIFPAAVAGLIYHLINQILLCTIRGLDEQRLPWQIWYTEYRWLWPHYAVLGSLALVVALGHQAFGPIGVIALMAPVAMMHLAIKQYLDHTRAYVNQLSQMNERLGEACEATLLALSAALDTRDDETEAHSQRVCRYTKIIGERLGVPADELAEIVRGALLHDLGKIGVPDSILLKPGTLTDEEAALVRKHPEIGYNMLASIPFLAKAAEIVLHHHEAYDGSGYPSGLAGNNIPLGARIFAVADAFDAITTARPYRKALSPAIACAEIGRCSGTQFDPQIVAAFLTIPIEDLTGDSKTSITSPPNSDSKASNWHLYHSPKNASHLFLKAN
jgi:diguanylate cyclase (GGDEF)-like protein